MPNKNDGEMQPRNIEIKISAVEIKNARKKKLCTNKLMSF